MGDTTEEVDQGCANNSMRRYIVEKLQTLFHQYNRLITFFIIALYLMLSKNHNIVIRADKTPVGPHARRFNAPTIDGVAIERVGENSEDRNIDLQRRNYQLQRLHETHRSYVALQCPILFSKGEYGYHFSIKKINPDTGNYNVGYFVSDMCYWIVKTVSL